MLLSVSFIEACNNLELASFQIASKPSPDLYVGELLIPWTSVNEMTMKVWTVFHL